MRCSIGVLLVASLASAQNTAEVTIPTIKARANQTVTVPARLAGKGTAITGLQFDLEFDATAIDLSIDAGTTPTKAGKQLKVVELAAGTLRLVLIGVNQTAIADGELLLFKVKARKPGKYSLIASAVSATDKNGEAVSLRVTPSTIEVQ